MRRVWIAAALVALGAGLWWWHHSRPELEPAALPSNPGPQRQVHPVAVIFLENRELADVLKDPDLSYLTSAWNGGQGPAHKFTQYYAVTHPSLPNYLAAFSGSTWGKDGTDSIAVGGVPGPALWDQLNAANISWKAYLQDMPKPCFTGNSAGTYVLKHNPTMTFDSISENQQSCAKAVPLSELATNLKTNNLPKVSFIAPGLCDDLHGDNGRGEDCEKASPELDQRANQWLKTTVPMLIQAGATVIITFDEGTTNEGGGGHVYTIELGQHVPTKTDNTTYSHYSLLAGLEDAFGLAKLGQAKSAKPLPMQ